MSLFKLILLLIFLPTFSIVHAQDSLVVIQNNDKYGYADSTGKVVIEPQFDFAGEFSQG